MDHVKFSVIVNGIEGLGKIQKIINMNIVWGVMILNLFIGNLFGSD